jgi:hypothetical protein
MSELRSEKVQLRQGAMPQHPTTTGLSSRDNEFLPKYEEAVNANLRNFSPLEGQEGKGTSAIQSPAKEKMPRWRRSLFILVPLLVVFAAVIGATITLFHHRAPTKHSTPDPATLLSSVTLTKRATVTITSTQTFTAPITPSIAASISSFYASWSADIASANSAAEAQVSEWLTISTTLTTVPTSTVALPSSDMDLSTPPPASTTAEIETTVSIAPSTLSTVSRSGPTGANFCGLPGTFCFNRKQDTNENKQSHDTEKIMTVWKYLKCTTTTITTRTRPPFPASVMDAYNSYLEQDQSSILSATSSLANSVLSSIAPPSISTAQPNPVTCVTSSTAGAKVGMRVFIVDSRADLFEVLSTRNEA